MFSYRFYEHERQRIKERSRVQSDLGILVRLDYASQERVKVMGGFAVEGKRV